MRSLGPRGARAHPYKARRGGESRCITVCGHRPSRRVFSLISSLIAVVLKRLGKCSIIDIVSAWKVFAGDFSPLIDDFKKQGQKLDACTFYLLLCSRNKIGNGYMTRRFHQSLRLFVVHIYWLLYQLTSEGKLPVWSRTCTAKEWLHQDDISASQPFWSLATETFLVVCLSQFTLLALYAQDHKAELTDAQVDWLMIVMVKDHTH